MLNGNKKEFKINLSNTVLELEKKYSNKAKFSLWELDNFVSSNHIFIDSNDKTNK